MDNSIVQVDDLLSKAWDLRLEAPQESQKLSQQARELCETHNNGYALITSLRNLVELYKIAHAYETALPLLEQALELLDKPDYSEHPAALDIFFQASTVYSRLGNTPKALSICYQAEKLAQKSHKPDQQAEVYKHLGNIQLFSGEPHKALELYQKALALFTQAGSKYGIATIYNNICHTNHKTNQLEESLTAGLAGLRVYESATADDNIPSLVHGYNLNNVGTAYLKLKQFDTAETYFQKAALVFEEESDLYGEIYALRGLAQVKMHHKKYDEAFAQFHAALSLAQKCEILAELVDTHFALAEAYKETGNFEQALFHHEKHHAYQKKALNLETEKKLRNLESAYKIQKAEQEAALYHQKNIALRAEVKRRELAEKEAAAAARTKSEFLANMSHEIRTPLNGIIGMTELLQSSGLTEQQEELAQIIQNSGETLLHIINDILDFSKIEAGKMELEMMPFSLRSAVESVIEMLAAKAAKKCLEIGYTMPPDVPQFIVGDVVRFQQILINLLNNGIKFTEQGEVFVHVQNQAINGKTAVLHIAVQDTGIGISDEAANRLFKSFSQVDSSVTRKYGGTGLGLAISKQLTEMMNGQMWVNSELGKGSTFHFTVQAPIETFTDNEEKNADLDPLHGEKVLVWLAHENGRLSLCHQLAALGMETIAATSLEEAVDHLQNHQVDAIIFDGQVDPAELAQLTASLSEQSPPMLGISRESQSLTYPGVATFLTKPVKLDFLYNQLRHLLEPGSENGRSHTKKFDHSFGAEFPCSILVVEDNVVNQKVTRKILEKLGYHAEIVSNGLEAVHRSAKEPFNVIFMDVQMPVMDGITATQEIYKQASSQKRPYIIAMTAHALKGDRERLLAAGMDDYLSKPVRLENVASMLKKYVEMTAA